MKSAQSTARVTSKQIALVHVAKARLGMNDNAYRTMLFRAASVKSSRELTPAGFRAVMEEFARLGFESSSHIRVPSFGRGRRLGMATEEQLAYIQSLWRQWARGDGGDEGLRRYLQKKFGVSHLRFLDRDGAGRLITALKAMAAWRQQHRTQNTQSDAPSAAPTAPPF
ncbi:MAG: regulatory protein GemA [Burkholderiales bacterium]|nr:regulatory protein GemA [Burkholderiales bacterium]